MLASRADGWLMKATHRFSRERKYAGNEATKLLVVADEVQEEKERRLKKVSPTVVHPLKSALLEARLEDVKEPNRCNRGTDGRRYLRNRLAHDSWNSFRNAEGDNTRPRRGWRNRRDR